MLKYDSYIIENSLYDGTKSIKIDDAKKIISELKDFKPNDIPIYRGIDLKGNSYLIDPKQDRRKKITSVETALIVEYSGLWDKYPKRQQSMCCINKKVETYGKVFRVIPFDNSKWGVSSSFNYKLSFRKLNFNHMNTITFFNIIGDLYKIATGANFIKLYSVDSIVIKGHPTYSTNKIIKDNYDIIINQIDELLMLAETTDFSQYNPYFINSKDFDLNQVFFRFKDAKQLIKYYFEPDENGFKCLSYIDLQKYFKKEFEMFDQELWTDSNCLLIENNTFNEIIS